MGAVVLLAAFLATARGGGHGGHAVLGVHSVEGNAGSEQAKQANGAKTEEAEQADLAKKAELMLKSEEVEAETVGKTEAEQHVEGVAKAAGLVDVAAAEMQAQDRVVRLLSERGVHEDTAVGGANSDSMGRRVGGMTWGRSTTDSDYRSDGISGDDVDGNRKYKGYKSKGGYKYKGSKHGKYKYKKWR